MIENNSTTSDTNPPRTIPGRNGGTLTPFRKGQSGNPRGGDTAGAIVKNYLNGMARRRYTTKQIEAIANNEKKPHLMRKAAKILLNISNNIQWAQFVTEHTDGRPKATVDINANAFLRTPADRAVEAVKISDRLRKILESPAN